jgi:hypothetical protein
MAYEGEHLYHCPASAFPWQVTFAVIVSGARWNPCGHALLNVGGATGTYFHIAGDGNDRPYMLRGSTAFQRYIRENGKKELRRQHIPISNPQGAQAKLEALTSRNWIWGVLPNNCASFVEEVIQAGGSTMGLYSNCPSRERF